MLKKNLDNLLRLSTECWFTISYWEIIDWDQADWENLKEGTSPNEYLSKEYFEILSETKEFGEKHFITDVNFLWVMGYMTLIFPYWFKGFDNDFAKWEKHSKDMIKKAFQLQPDHLIAKMLSLPEKSEEYKVARGEVKTVLDNYFVGNSAIERYFRGVLSRNS